MSLRFRGAGHLRLVADTFGDWDGPLVLFLHGGGQIRQSWGQAARTLGERGYLSVTIDLRGHGDSEWASDGDYHMDRFAEDVRAVVDSFGRPAALVGASLGGLASILAAGEEPRVACTALVLVDVTPHMQAAGRQAIVDFMLGNPDGFATLDEAADAVARFLPHRPRPSDVSGLRRNLREAADGRLHWHWDRRTMTSPGAPRFTTAERFDAAIRRVDAPILLVRGQRSDVVSLDDVQLFRRAVPTAEYVDVADAAHMVAGDQNSAFLAAIGEFLDRTVMPGGR